MERTHNTDRLDRLCDQFRTKLKLRHLATALAMLVVLAILLAAAFAAADWWRHLEWVARLVLLAVYLAAVGAAAWLALIEPMTRRWSNRQVLSYLDATSPEGRDMLMDLYELAGAREHIQELASDQGRQFADQALADLAPLAEQVRPGRSFVGRATGLWVALAAIVLVGLAGFSAAFPGHARAGLVRLFNPFSDARWPHRTTIVVYRADPDTRKPMLSGRTREPMRVTDQGVSVPVLAKLPLVAEVSGLQPDDLTLYWKGDSGEEWIPEPMQLREGLAYHEFPKVGEPITFYVRGGDYQTDRLRIHIIERPYVEKVTVDYDYPDYAGVPDRTGVVGGGLYGLQGTRVKMTFDVSMPVDEAVFVLEEELPADALLAVTGARLRQLLARQESLLSLTHRYAGAATRPADQREALAKLGSTQSGLAKDVAEQTAAMAAAAGRADTFAADAEVLRRSAAAGAGLSDRLTEAADALAGGRAPEAAEAQRAAVAALKQMRAALVKRRRMSTVGGSDTRYGMSLQLRHNGRYAIHLNRDGYTQARKEAHRIRVVEDRLPSVHMISPAPSLVETRRANIQVAFDAADDYGLKAVEFVYKAEGDRKTDTPAKEKILDDKVTGPIDPAKTGEPTKHVPARFKWRLGKMEELPRSGRLTYYVRVVDIYPSGDRKVVTSSVYQVKLVRPSEFHREAFERAKGLLAEVLIAWDNQLTAYELGGQWLGEGSGEETDELWAGLTDQQQRSIVAARAMQHHLRVLDEKSTRNNMQQDFMNGRLGVVTALLYELVTTHHVKIDEALRTARPRTSAEALPQRRKALRQSALEKPIDGGWSARQHQKMAVLVLERLLRKILDWVDLQTCIITTKLMYEQQEEVLDRTQAIAGTYIGKSILDLTDEQQKDLITLGKQQRAVFDTETGLESQLAFLMERAEKQQRRSIRDPLMAAFSVLRNKRVNDNLKKAYRMIANNQPSQIVRQQKDALAALKVVETGLIVAGQDVEKDQPLDLAMVITGRDVFKPPKPRLATTGPAATATSGPIASITAGPVGPPVLPEPETTLAELIRKAAELEDSVRGRSVYLHANSDPTLEMPRFIKLKLLRLAEWQQMAGEKLLESIGKAKSDGSPAVKRFLASLREELDQSAKLIAAADVSVTAQQLQSDTVTTLNDLLQLMAMEQVVEDAAGEIRRQHGVDPFGRDYLLRDVAEDKAKKVQGRQDLKLAEEIVGRLNEARMRQRDVLRKVRRFHAQPAKGRAAAAVEAANRRRATRGQKAVAALLDEAAERTAKLTEEVRPDVLAAGVGPLQGRKGLFAAYAGRIAAGKTDAALALEIGGKQADPDKGIPRVAGTIDLLGSAVQNLRDLLEARVRPPEIARAPPRQMTPEQWRRRTSPEHLQKLLAANTTIDPEIRKRMIKALAHKDKFPPKYRELIAAYYASFVAEQQEALEKDEDKPPGGGK